MPIIFLNINGSGSLNLINNTNVGSDSFLLYNSSSIYVAPPTASGIVFSNINTIISALRVNSSSLRNPDFYDYLSDGTSVYINDGGSDLFDTGNFTAPWLLSNTSYVNTTTMPIPPLANSALSYLQQTSSLSDTNFTYASIGYQQSSRIYNPLTMIGTRNGTGSIGFQKAGNVGADGSGTLVTASIYSGSLQNGFTAYAFYRQSFGAGGDPALCDVYVLLGHTNWTSSFGTVVSASYMTSTDQQGAALYATGSSVSEVLAMTTLLGKTPLSGSISFADVKTVVDNYISIVRTALGY